MTHLFQAYPTHVCLRYDMLFHQAAARDPLLRWNTFKNDLLLWCSTRRAFRPSITARLGPLPTQPPKLTTASAVGVSLKKATHIASGAEICKRFNQAGCTLGEACKYVHLQAWQRKSGKHPDIVDLLRRLFLTAAQRNFTIQLTHIPGKYNCIADALSRKQLNRFFRLAPQASPAPTAVPTALAQL